MASPAWGNDRPGLPLPTELLVNIFRQFEVYDLPDDPHDDYLPTYDTRNVDSITWLTTTTSATQNICNIRLVCKSFLDASIPSFANILGQRRFRLTLTGLQDLGDIGHVDALTPWIKTLTFGAADVASCGTHSELRKLVHHIDDDGAIYHALKAIDQAAKDYNQVSRATTIDCLVNALQAFPKLESLRVVIDDRPCYLGGWLTAEQRHYISTNLKPGTELFQLGEELFGWPSTEDVAQGLYLPRKARVVSTVLRAARQAGTHVLDLKLSRDFCSTWDCWCLPETLCTLHIMVSTHFFRQRSPAGMDEGQILPFPKVLARMENLQDVTLAWKEKPFHPNRMASIRARDRLDKLDMTEDVFRALQKASNLRRFNLQGTWSVYPDHLVNFFKNHASSLRQLILSGTNLFGDHWL